MGLLNTKSIAAILIVTAISLGCSTRLERHFREAQHSLIALQVANPDPAEAHPIMDGVTAERAVESSRDGKTAVPNRIPTMLDSVSSN